MARISRGLFATANVLLAEAKVTGDRECADFAAYFSEEDGKRWILGEESVTGSGAAW